MAGILEAEGDRTTNKFVYRSTFEGARLVLHWPARLGLTATWRYGADATAGTGLVVKLA
jgi:hypothetical protein